MSLFFLEYDPTNTTGCEHCDPGVPCDPVTGACVKGNVVYKLTDTARKKFMLFVINISFLSEFCATQFCYNTYV